MHTPENAKRTARKRPLAKGRAPEPPARDTLVSLPGIITVPEGLTAADYVKLHMVLDVFSKVQSALVKAPGFKTACPPTEKRDSHMHPVMFFITNWIYYAQRACVLGHFDLAGSVPKEWEWNLQHYRQQMGIVAPPNTRK